MLAPDLPEPDTQFYFDPERDWHVDFYWPEAMLVFEMESDVHRIKDKYLRDMEKYNRLTMLGYRLLRTTRQLMEADPAALVGMLREALRDLGEQEGGSIA
jgi:very-short-patch-repair endonuclease